LVVLGIAGAARAQDADSGDAPRAPAIHAFVSQGAVKTTGNEYLVDNSKRGSFAFSEAGINFTSQLTDKLRVGIQLFAYQLGSLGNYQEKADFYYLDYHLKDSFGIRAGRVKLAYGLYNDVSDIDAARAQVLLPTSIYPPNNRNNLLAVNGAEIYGYVSLRRAGALEYRVFGGTVSLVIPSQVGSPTPISNAQVPYLAGARLMWEAPVPGLRFGFSAVTLKLEENAVLPTPPALSAAAVLYADVFSVEYAAHDLLLAAEYAQQRVITTDNMPSLLPLSTIVSDGGYVLGAYHLTRWLEPAAYYSLYYTNVSDRSGREHMQHDLAGTIRFDLNNFWIVKLEAHFMHGTAIVADTTQATDPANWGLFLIKTTAYF
jgi:hypothetical protein